MVISKPLEWIISNNNIVTYFFLLTFVFGLIYYLIWGKR